MVRETLPERLRQHAFILGWLCFVALPGLLASATPELSYLAPSATTSHHLGKLVRPEIGVATSAQPCDERSKRDGSKRPEPAVDEPAGDGLRQGRQSRAALAERLPAGGGTRPPYSSRAPPLA